MIPAPQHVLFYVVFMCNPQTALVKIINFISNSTCEISVGLALLKPNIQDFLVAVSECSAQPAHICISVFWWRERHGSVAYLFLLLSTVKMQFVVEFC